MARAKAEGKPALLLIYAHWCPKCRALAPKMEGEAFTKAAEGLVLIAQDQDLRPEWLGRYQRFGGYVPRIFFLDPEGNVREELKSSHARFPYFYQAHKVSELFAQMDKAAGGS